MIPQTFRVMRHLLNRIDGGKTDGSLLLPEFNTDIPEYMVEEANFMAKHCAD